MTPGWENERGDEEMPDGMPVDPFGSDDFALDLLGFGSIMREALRESWDRADGDLFRAVGCLPRRELECILVAWVVGDRFGRFGLNGGVE